MMINRTLVKALALLSIVTSLVTGQRPTKAPIVPITATINEFHYDNVGDDSGEFIEIASSDVLTGWSVELYNGSTGRRYRTAILPNGSRTVRSTVNGTGATGGIMVTVTVPIPVDGTFYTMLDYPSSSCSGKSCIQNGENDNQVGPGDGIALVDPAGTVIEFLSYEGTFKATDGDAKDLWSVNVGVLESSRTTVGYSLQRTDPSTWVGPKVNSKGNPN